MGRYKLGPQGTYWDPNDSGPDQASPDQIAQFQKTQQPVQPNTGYSPPTGGINPGPNPSPSFPQFPGTPAPHTGPWMPTPNPEFDAFYAQRKASGLTFPQIMDEWQAQHPQKPNVLDAPSMGQIGSIQGAAMPASGSPGGVRPIGLPSGVTDWFAAHPQVASMVGYRPPTGGINPWGTMGGLQMLGPKALL